MTMLTKGQIEKAARRLPGARAKFMQGEAIIRVPYKERKPKPIPTVTAEQFEAWCGKLGHTKVARFINEELGTSYQAQDIYHMRRGDETIYTRIRILVRDFKHPLDLDEDPA